MSLASQSRRRHRTGRPWHATSASASRPRCRGRSLQGRAGQLAERGGALLASDVIRALPAAAEAVREASMR